MLIQQQSVLLSSLPAWLQALSKELDAAVTLRAEATGLRAEATSLRAEATGLRVEATGLRAASAARQDQINRLENQLAQAKQALECPICSRRVANSIMSKPLASLQMHSGLSGCFAVSLLIGMCTSCLAFLQSQIHLVSNVQCAGPCGHLFCHPCGASWLDRESTCATCRRTASLQRIYGMPETLSQVP